MKRYTLNPEHIRKPLIFDAIQWAGDESILKQIDKLCKKINDIGKHHVTINMHCNKLHFFREEHYGIGMSISNIIREGDYLLFTEDDCMFMDKQSFEERYIEVQN